MSFFATSTLYRHIQDHFWRAVRISGTSFPDSLLFLLERLTRDRLVRRFAIHFTGKTHVIDLQLHKRYGRVVRVGPNTLLFSDYAAFETIYGFNKNIVKGDFYAAAGDPDPEKTTVLQMKNEQEHRDRARKIVSVAVIIIEMETSRVVSVYNGLSFYLAYLVSCNQLRTSCMQEHYYSDRATSDCHTFIRISSQPRTISSPVHF